MTWISISLIRKVSKFMEKINSIICEFKFNQALTKIRNTDRKLKQKKKYYSKYQ